MSDGRAHGRNGRMKVNGQNVALVTNWSINKQIQELDVTVMGDEDPVYLSGFANRTINASLILDHQIDDGQKLLKSAGTVELELITGGGLTYRGGAIVNQESITNDKDDTTRFTVQFRGSGPWQDPLSSS